MNNEEQAIKKVQECFPKTELSFDEQLKHLEENYDGVASLALYKATGGVRCKTMSYENCYIKCAEELRKIFIEHPELLKKEISFNKNVITDNIDDKLSRYDEYDGFYSEDVE